MNNAFWALSRKLRGKIKPPGGKSPGNDQPEENKKYNPGGNLRERLEQVKERLGESSDVVIREFSSGNGKVKVAAIFIDGMVDRRIIHDYIIRPIQWEKLTDKARILSPANALDILQKHLTSGSELSVAPDLTQALKRVLSGDTALLIDGEPKILVFGTRFWMGRPVTEPETESAVRGPREGFTETIRVNSSLLRRRIRHEKLRFETMKVGRRTNTDIMLVYIEDVVNQRVLNEVRRRVAAIDTDSILESGYLEEFIEDSTWSIFPQIEHTERADKAAAAILEGRVVILTDNTPFSLIIPTSFFQFIQASEDYYERPFVGFFLRLLRLFVLNVALILPAIYVAVTSFHPEMLPTPLLLSIAAAREGVPFPAVGEALIMEGTFEVLREAGVRLPKTVGQAVSIVGGLVVGDAAIRAGIVSPAMVIVVAATAVSTFAIPAFKASIALRLLRFLLLILAGFMGLYGVIFGLLIILLHLASLQSFGVPYLTPLVHGTAEDALKTLARPPWRLSLNRPRMLATQDRRRQSGTPGIHPTPEDKRELFHDVTGDDQNAGER